MGLKTILVCLTTTNNAEALMKVASGLARKHNAHLIGIHVMEALLVYPGIAMHMPDPAFAKYNASQREEAEAIEKVFRKYTDNEDFVGEWRMLKSESASACDRMIESARASDLVILSQEDREGERVDQAHIQARVIRESGRPVLMVPTGFDGDEIASKIVVGWSATREATRAAHDVLEVAQPGSEIFILRAQSHTKDDLEDFTANEMAEMYDRHGLKATIIHRDTDGQRVGHILNKEAFEQGADLIVTGAFGHSRTYDFVIGAATRDLLSYAEVPVLFSK
ncbi:MAG: universal stress protein [Litoreibacter sp.]|nr:universal stress protein [Litoreibacter sp.]